MDDAIEKLLQKNPRLWRGRSSAPDWQGIASGYPLLDQHLPGGGWPPYALTEILLAQYGTGELKLLMPALARLSQSNHDAGSAGWIAWVAPPYQPYPPALVQWGVDISRVLIVRPGKSTEALWAAEQALSSGNCSAVLLWSNSIDDASSRRLQLAAEESRSWAIAFRPLDAARQNSAAALRIRLMPDPRGVELRVLKSRGGRPVTLYNVTDDDAGSGIHPDGVNSR